MSLFDLWGRSCDGESAIGTLGDAGRAEASTSLRRKPKLCALPIGTIADHGWLSYAQFSSNVNRWFENSTPFPQQSRPALFPSAPSTLIIHYGTRVRPQ
jgi:hypothetical protein